MANTESNKSSVKKVTPQLRPGLGERVAGEAVFFNADLKPYLPSDLIGGSVPHVVGTEEEAVWNAASQACATEKVHFVYSAEGGRCWYLACPSSSLASNPDSWCPLAAALPGNSEYWDRETVYLYEQEGLASALRWDTDTGRMQIFLGASRTLLPKVQSMSANFVTINPDGLTPVPWRNRALKTEMLSRATARLLLISGIMAVLLVASFLAMQFIMTSIRMGNLADVKARTEAASQELITKSYLTMQSDVPRHMARIQELLDDLTKIDGTLVRYEAKAGGEVEWEALVSPAFRGGTDKIQGEVQPGIAADGRVRIKGKK